MKTLQSSAKDYFVYFGDREGWFIALTQHRDSGLVDQSNFAMFLERLGGESDDVAVEHFSHCLVGWTEAILLRPESPKVAEAEALLEELEDYPLLSEDDHSRREWDTAHETWQCMSVKERVAAIQRYGRSTGGGVFEARHDYFTERADPTGSLFQYLAQD